MTTANLPPFVLQVAGHYQYFKNVLTVLRRVLKLAAAGPDVVPHGAFLIRLRLHLHLQ
jgi:hypothetical protein